MQTKNIFAISATAAALSLVLGVSLVPAALAFPAVSIEKGGCVMGDTGANPIIPVDAKVTYVQTASSSSSNTGTITFECIASVPNDTGKAMIFNFDNTGGVKCGSVNFDFLTTEWQETISATGNAHLICHLTFQ